MRENTNQQLGDYRILEPIGAGGMGEVYLAEHVRLRKVYALKALPEALAQDQGFVERFHDEGRVMAELRHPGIVEVHTMGEAGGVYFLVMDYVAGPGKDRKPLTLQDHLKSQPGERLAETEARRWAIQIAEALAYAHARGVVHRDLKPANVLIDIGGNAKLTDFGLAKAVGGEFILSQVHKSLARKRAAVGAAAVAIDDADTLVAGSPASPSPGSDERILGTYDYMAPEQRGEGGEINPTTDTYAFGLLLYRVLTGKRVKGLAGRPSEAAPGLSRRWDAIVARCLKDDQAERYPSAEALLVDLRTMGPARRRWPMLAGAAACALALVGVLAVTAWPPEPAAGPVEPAPAPVAPGAPAPGPQEASPSLAEVIRVRTEAETAWESVQGLDRGQGFAKLFEEATKVRRTAEELYAQKLNRDAKSAYEDLLSRSKALQELARERTAALAAKAEAERAEATARAAGAERDGADPWRAAKESASRAGEDLESGRFADAIKAWQAAKEGYARAEEQATAVAIARRAREDYETALQAAGPEKLERYGGEAWKAAAEAEARAKAAGGDLEKAALAFKSATELLSKAVKAAEEGYEADQRSRKIAELLAFAKASDSVEKGWTALQSLEQILDLQPGHAEGKALKAKIVAYYRPGVTITNSLGMKLTCIPPGEFLMGSPPGEEGRDDDESQHRVKITRPFYLGVTEVTQAEWRAVMKSDPSHFKGGKLPVELVSWEDAKELCRKLSEREGKRYRLPTEAEWEYACRAGTAMPFHTGGTISTSQANYDGNSTYGSGQKGVYREKTVEVGSFPANAWGLHDMHGNVWEWCEDWYGAYPQGEVENPRGPSSGESRVLRGGSWFNDPWDCRSAIRRRFGPGNRYFHVGFRVALDF